MLLLSFFYQALVVVIHCLYHNTTVTVTTRQLPLKHSYLTQFPISIWTYENHYAINTKKLYIYITKYIGIKWYSKFQKRTYIKRLYSSLTYKNTMVTLNDLSPKYPNILKDHLFIYTHQPSYKEGTRITQRVLGDHVNKASSTRHRLRGTQTHDPARSQHR